MYQKSLSILLLSALMSGAPVSSWAQSPFGGFLQTQPSAESAQIEILQVDNARLALPLTGPDSVRATEGRPIEAGWKVTIQGTISSRDFQVFVLVHALLSDTWIVQSTVSRPSKTGIWRTTCYLGAERKGQDEDYEIIAVASAKNDQYRTGQRIPANQFPPTDLSQSETILVRRVRSPNP